MKNSSSVEAAEVELCLEGIIEKDTIYSRIMDPDIKRDGDIQRILAVGISRDIRIPVDICVTAPVQRAGLLTQADKLFT